MGGGTSLQLIGSVAVGLTLALAYHVFMTRSQLWLSRSADRALPALSVATLFLRLSLLGLVALVLVLFTPINIVVTLAVFVALFTVLSGWSLYRYVSGRGALGAARDNA